MTLQASLPFVREILAEFPQAQPTPDSLGEAEATDQHRYYIKGDNGGVAVRASEWICTHLAEIVGIAAPSAAVLKRRNGDLVFGSRRLAGVSDEVVTQNHLITLTVTNAPGPAMGMVGVLSAIYAFDLFVFNEDRRFGNYLSLDDNGVRRFYAFDFSRALFWRWPWKSFPIGATNTYLCGRILRQRHGFDHGAADGVIDRLGTVPTARMTAFIESMPEDWLVDPLRQEFIDWWDGPDRGNRLAALKKGLADGTLL